MSDPFRARLDESPEDWDLRRVYADWLDEQGRAEEATGQRWQADRKLRPATDDDYNASQLRANSSVDPHLGAIWGNFETLGEGTESWSRQEGLPMAMLPNEVFALIKSDSKHHMGKLAWAQKIWRYFLRVADAEAALAQALAQLEYNSSSLEMTGPQW
jgi:uncharacterized protein (TIGR02996 family)